MGIHTIYYYRDFMDSEFPFKLEYREEANLNQLPHAHEHFQICYLQRGACLHHVQDQAYLMTKGDMLAIPPFVPHRLEPYQGEKVSLVQVDFMPIIADPGELLPTPLFPKIHLSGDNQALAEQLLARMREESDRKETGYRHVIRADLTRLLVTLFRQSLNEAEWSRESGIESRPLFHEAVRYLEERYSEHVSLDELARRAAMSPTYFSYLFKVLMGQPFTHYLNELRIRKASDLLRTTDDSVTEICFAAGFNNLSHFTRCFRKAAGMSPLAYRRQARLLSGPVSPPSP